MRIITLYQYMKKKIKEVASIEEVIKEVEEVVEEVKEVKAFYKEFEYNGIKHKKELINGEYVITKL